MRNLDRALSLLLIFGGIVNTVISNKRYSDNLPGWTFATCTTGFMFLFAVIGLLRASRPNDQALGWICTVAGMGWLLICIYYARNVLNSLFNPYGLVLTLGALGLLGFSVRTILQSPD